MAHFAELDDNDNILRVIVIDNNDILDDAGKENESIGIAFCKSLFGDKTNWAQTSYNNNYRNHFAGTGDYFDRQADVFIPQNRGSVIVYDAEIIDAEIVQGELI